MNSQDKFAKESTPKVGIVIPIYNVAPYLVECLDSVLNQTYKNFYAVLVNDGSTDESKAIALEFVAKDSRFVLIDKENGGLSSARNAGIAYFGRECYFGNLSLELHSVDSAESSLRGRIVDSHEAIQIYRHTEPLGEVSKPRELNKSNESMTKERINNSHKFTQSKKIVDDSKVAKMDSSRCRAQNDESMDCYESLRDSCNDESSYLTLYTNKNATHSNPLQIDYIIFLDSDDFWEANLLQTCVDSAKSQNLDIIWFNYQAFYDSTEWGGGSTPNSTENCIESAQNNKSTRDSTLDCINNTSQNHTTKNSITKRYEPKNEQTLLDILGYKSAQTITFQSFLQRAKERNINNFWWAWQGMIDFRFLQEINLCFYEGIIHEDHLFGAFLFAQSGAIAIIPQKLYNYLIRKGSTMSAWSKDEIPSYVKPFCAHFPYQKARAYFRIYSLVISVQGLMEFAKTHFKDEAHQTKNSLPQDSQKYSQKQSDLNKIRSNLNQAQDDFLALTLPLLLEIICEIFYFYKDPYHLKAQTAKIIKDLGAESSMLPGRVRKYFALYTGRWRVLWWIGVLKRVERKIRRFIKN